MRLKDIFFKDYEKNYLNFLDIFYENNPIIFIKNELKKEIKIRQKIINKKSIFNRNIEFWILRGWSEEQANEKINIIKKNYKYPKYTIFCWEYWVDKGYSKKDAKNKVSDFQRKNSLKFTKKRKENPEKYKHMLSPMTIDFWIKKGYSKKESIIKIKSQRKLHNEYWLKRGYNEEDAIINVKLYQKENSKKHKLKWKNLKHTTEFKEQQPTRIEYWIKKGFSKEISKIKLTDRQCTFSKEICIRKYGEKIGLEIFNERQHKWQDTLQKNGNLKGGYSKISQDLFNKLLEYYNNKDKEYVYFATKNKELRLNESSDRLFLYDFVDLKNKKIIEYNGDLFHANPSKYKKNDTPHPFKKELKAEDIWLKDNLKRKIAEDEGFDYLIIWDSDYKQNSNFILNKCVKFLL